MRKSWVGIQLRARYSSVVVQMFFRNKRHVPRIALLKPLQAKPWPPKLLDASIHHGRCYAIGRIGSEKYIAVLQNIPVWEPIQRLRRWLVARVRIAILGWRFACRHDTQVLIDYGIVIMKILDERYILGSNEQCWILETPPMFMQPLQAPHNGR